MTDLFSALEPTDIVAYIDGGARGNPGPAGFGVRIESKDGALVEEFSEAIGVATNNVAEYRGLLAALEWARAHHVTAVHIRSDSLLLVQQMLGNYKVKNAGTAAAAREGAAARARIGRRDVRARPARVEQARRPARQHRYGRRGKGLIAPASRPAPEPSRR